MNKKQNLIIKLYKKILLLSVLILFSHISISKDICPSCGEGTPFPSCFNLAYIEIKIQSILDGCTDADNKFIFKGKSLANKRSELLDKKLMNEFCEDPNNNMGAACIEYNYSRINEH
jgi:hypothetical protein